MILVAPRSAKLIETRGARFTLLLGYVFLFLALRLDAAALEGGQPVLAGRARLRLHRHRRGSRRHAGVPLAHRLGPGPAGRHGVGDGGPPAGPRRRDHAVDLRRAAHRRLRDRGRRGDHGGAERAAGHDERRRTSSRSPSPARRTSRSSTRSTPSRSSPAPRPRSSTVRTGRTPPASSRCSSARRSCSSSSPARSRRSSCWPRITPKTHQGTGADDGLQGTTRGTPRGAARGPARGAPGGALPDAPEAGLHR